MTVDLRTRYLGLELGSPIVASAAPHNNEPAMARRLEAAGVGAIVLPSLFEEEILAEELELNRSLEQGTEHFAEALDYFPAVDSFVGPSCRRGPPGGEAASTPSACGFAGPGLVSGVCESSVMEMAYPAQLVANTCCGPAPGVP